MNVLSVVQRERVAAERAIPRTLLGNISEMMTHVTGASDMAYTALLDIPDLHGDDLARFGIQREELVEDRFAHKQGAGHRVGDPFIA